MKIKVETWEYPLKWDDLPKKTLIYDLDNEKQKELYLNDMQNIKDNELVNVQTDTDKTEIGYEK